jgi:hypothetical protein
VTVFQETVEGGFAMKMGMLTGLGIVAAAVVATTGCGRKPPSESSATAGPMERTGAAVDTAAEKTTEAARKGATATKDAAGAVVEKTGAVLEKAGSAVEGAGADMQK